MLRDNLRRTLIGPLFSSKLCTFGRLLASIYARLLKIRTRTLGPRQGKRIHPWEYGVSWFPTGRQHRDFCFVDGFSPHRRFGACSGERYGEDRALCPLR